MITFICYMYEIQNNLTISGWLYLLPVFMDMALISLVDGITDKIKGK